MFACKERFVCVALALHHGSSIGRKRKLKHERERAKKKKKKSDKNVIAKIYVAVVPQGSLV